MDALPSPLILSFKIWSMKKALLRDLFESVENDVCTVKTGKLTSKVIESSSKTTRRRPIKSILFATKTFAPTLHYKFSVACQSDIYSLVLTLHKVRIVSTIPTLFN